MSKIFAIVAIFLALQGCQTKCTVTCHGTGTPADAPEGIQGSCSLPAGSKSITVNVNEWTLPVNSCAVRWDNE